MTETKGMTRGLRTSLTCLLLPILAACASPATTSPPKDREPAAVMSRRSMIDSRRWTTLDAYPVLHREAKGTVKYWFRLHEKLVKQGKLYEDQGLRGPSTLWERSGWDPAARPISFNPPESRPFLEERWTDGAHGYRLLNLGSRSREFATPYVNQAHADALKAGRAGRGFKPTGKFARDLELAGQLDSFMGAAIFQAYLESGGNHNITDIVDVYAQRQYTERDWLVLLDDDGLKLDSKRDIRPRALNPRLLATAKIAREDAHYPELPDGPYKQWKSRRRQLLPFVRRIQRKSPENQAILARMRELQAEAGGPAGEICRFVRFQPHSRPLRRAFLRRIFEAATAQPDPLKVIYITVDESRADWFGYLRAFKDVSEGQKLKLQSGGEESLKYVRTDSNEFKEMMAELADDSDGRITRPQASRELAAIKTDSDEFRKMMKDLAR
jgi:hypothetical protein